MNCLLCGKPEGEHAHDGLWCPIYKSTSGPMYSKEFSFISAEALLTDRTPSPEVSR